MSKFPRRCSPPPRSSYARLIVRYMVENSLKRFWLDDSSQTRNQGEMEYYLDELRTGPEVQSADELRGIRDG